MYWTKIERYEDLPETGKRIIICYYNKESIDYKIKKWSEKDMEEWMMQSIIAWADFEEYQERLEPIMIIKIIADEFNIMVKDILGEVRKRRFVDARRIAAMLIKKTFNLSYPETGRILKKDHSTILHYNKTINNLLDTNKQFKNKYKMLSEKLSKKRNMIKSNKNKMPELKTINQLLDEINSINIDDLNDDVANIRTNLLELKHKNGGRTKVSNTQQIIEKILNVKCKKE